MNRKDLTEKLRSTNIMQFLDSPYANTLKGKAAQQFELLAEDKGRIAEDNLEDFKALAIAGMSVEIKSMAGNFSGDNTTISDEEAVKRAQKSTDILYKNLDKDPDEEDDEDYYED
jgi:hypothetical protein